MLAAITPRMYAFVALCTTAVCWAIQYFDRGKFFATYLDQQGVKAAGLLPQGIVNTVVYPIKWAVGDWIGGIFAGLFWPLTLVWLLFLVVMIVFAFIAPGLSNVQETYEAG